MSVQTVSLSARRSPFREFVQKHAVLLLIVLVYALTWPFMFAEVLGTRGVLPGRLPIGLQLVQAFMPAVAALILAGLTGGRAAVRRLLGRLLIWRVGAQWYFAALVGFALLCLGAVAAHNALGLGPVVPWLAPEAAEAGALGIALNVLLLIVVGVFTNGEELAWRGFALPRLQARYNALAASLIIGGAWGVFHLPLFWAIGSSQADMPLASSLISWTAASVLFTWLFNNTRGSVLLATLAHAAVNTWTRIVAIDHGSAELNWALTAVVCAAALLVVGLYGPRHLARRAERIQDADVPSAA